MHKARRLATLAAISSTLVLNGCGSDAHGAFNSSADVAPTAVIHLAGNAGDGAASLGWDAPETGTQPLTYTVTIEPASTPASILYSGTHALIQGLSNDVTYTLSVTAKNAAGESAATTILLKPAAIDTSAFSTLTQDLADVNSPSGITDASLLNTGNTVWMTYASINTYQLASHSVQDVSTSLAYSNDSGASFTYLKTVGLATSATIAPTTIINPCGNVACSGRWGYGAPFLVDDSSDPDASRRFKLFALKYFLYPPATPAALYTLGAIVMWTAPSPESTWSSESVVLSWNSTPQELSPKNNIRTIDPALAECIALTEGSATTYRGALDFVFACPNAGDAQKIVLLRSSDHASTFEYVSTPLTAADAAAQGALYFAAPALPPTETSAPVLIATPVVNRTINGTPTRLNAYSGCSVFPFADEETGTLFRTGSAPLALLNIPFIDNHTNGACAWDRGIGASGILMNDGDASASVPFSILNTAKRL